MTEMDWGVCPICGKKYRKTERVTVRESFFMAGGGVAGDDPSHWAHVNCDKKEQAQLALGRIELSDLWKKVERPSV